ncbi:MAG: presenilin family intramembrane aspartyl protease PSH [Nitrososphaerota archaeon]|nr:presenilin family intramembrane aspartyl protease PSH [Nitrososphaerota archaeon]
MNIATLTIVVLYITAGLISLGLAPLYVVNELTLFENPENPMNALFLIFSVIIVFVIVMIIAKFGFEVVLKGLFYFSAFTVLFVTISILIPDSLFSIIVAMVFSVSILILLNRFYKWYIVDAVGVFLSASLAAWFGVSLSPHILVILLVLMAVYDYFAVKSGSMVSLAEKTLKMNLPTMLVSPIRKFPKELKVGEGEERRGAFLGLGDVAFPNMLTVSTFLNTGKFLAALLVLIGGLAGLIIVLRTVRYLKKPQPGLPYIGLGAVLAWLVSRLAF